MFTKAELSTSSKEDPEEQAHFLPKLTESRHSRRSSWSAFLTGAVLSLTLCTAVMAVMLSSIWLHEPGMVGDGSFGEASTWSPLMDAVQLESKDFDNAFSHQTIYRGPPTAERDKAWKSLWEHGFDKGLRVPADKMAAINRSRDTDGRAWVPVSEQRGGGYFAMIEVFHQLHCLDMVRQFTWLDYYEQHPEVETPLGLQSSPVARRMHIDHCLEALRISLMCHGDVTPYLVQFDDSNPAGITADFSPHHKCRKFEPILEYMKEKAFRGVCAGGKGGAHKAHVCLEE